MNKNTLLQQIKNRRKKLGLKQSHMTMRIGMSRQKYGLIENQGNPTLENLNLITLGLNCQLVLRQV
ncbi:helix-turn-helix domain-containing protein [Marinomonas spartinae]|nr:helix-turn-helix transcriptional regulator [Marinomonas spartinae]